MHNAMTCKILTTSVANFHLFFQHLIKFHPKKLLSLILEKFTVNPYSPGFDSDIYRCHILTSEVDPRTKRVKYL